MENLVTYPMNAPQKGVAILADFLHSLDALALILYVDFKSEIDEERMLEAIRETGKRLPYLRLRFRRGEDGTARQFLSDAEPLPTELTDFAPESEEEQEEQFRAWNREYFPGGYEDIQLYRFRLLRYPDGHKGLYFCLEHLIMDGYSGIYTLQYLNQVYKALCKGTELPAPGPEPWKLIEDDFRFRSSPKYRAGVEKLLEAYGTEPQFTSVNGLGSPEFIEGRRCGKKQEMTQFSAEVIRHPLAKTLTDRVAAAAKNHGVAPQVFYLLALRSYLGHVCQTDDVTVRSMMTCRSTLYEKRCGMNVANSHWLRSVLSDDCAFSDALVKLSNIQLDIMRYARINYTDMLEGVYKRYQVGEGVTYAPTWLSFFPPVEKEADDPELSVKFVSNGFAATPLYMLVMPDSNRGTMSAAYWYAVGYTRPESIERFHSFMLRFLENGLAAPEQSLGSLIAASLA